MAATGTELLSAIENDDNDEVTRLLTEDDADPNYAVDDETPVIFYAVRNGNVDIVQTLHERGADLDTFDGATAKSLLTVAIESEGPLVLEYLLSNGLDPNMSTDVSDPPLFLAVEAEPTRALELTNTLILHGAKVNEQFDKEYNTVLHRCAHLAEPAPLVELLLANGADARLTNGAGDNVPMYFYKNGQSDDLIVRLYRAQGREWMNEYTLERRTFLHLVITSGPIFAMPGNTLQENLNWLMETDDPRPEVRLAYFMMMRRKILTAPRRSRLAEDED